MNFTEKQEVELRTTVASLYYLAKDAESAGLDEVSKTIINTINELDMTLKKDGVNLADLIIKRDLLPLLDFMYKYSNEEKFEMIAEMIMELENEDGQPQKSRKVIN